MKTEQIKYLSKYRNVPVKLKHPSMIEAIDAVTTGRFQQRSGITEYEIKTDNRYSWVLGSWLTL